MSSAFSSRPLDTIQEVETPENIVLQLRVAGPVPRILAFAIDSALRYSVLLIGSMALTNFGQVGVGISLILFFLLEWFYPVFFEVFAQGATPGKKAVHLRVVEDDGVPVGFASSLIRNLLRAADFLPLLYGAGLVSMLSNSQSKRLGDLAAGTLVIHADTPQAAPARLPDGDALAIRLPLTAPEQQLIVDYAERSNLLHEERQNELVTLLPDLGSPRSADISVAQDRHAQLLSHARWLSGQAVQRR